MSHPRARYRNLPSALAVAAPLLVVLQAAAQEDVPRPMPAVPGAPVGSEVFVSLAGDPAPGRRLSLSFGGFGSGYESLGRLDAGPEGVLSLTVTVPQWAKPNQVYMFFVNLGGGVRLFSDPFVVTAPDGSLQVRGTVTEVTGGCVVVTAVDQTRFAVRDVATEVAAGARVTVDGVLATVPAEQGGLVDSPCTGQVGIPVRARGVRTG